MASEARFGPDQGLQEAIDTVRGHRRFLVVSHVDPDPDAIGSILAMDGALRKLGMDSLPITPDPIPEAWRFLPGSDRLRTPQDLEAAGGLPFEPEVALVIDTEPARTGKALAFVKRAPLLVNLDHHPTNQGKEGIAVVRPHLAAAGELVYQAIRLLGVELDPELATCLYAAILTDTGGFQFSNTSSRTLAVAAELVRAGADPGRIASNIYETRSWGYFRLLAMALATLERSPDNRIAWLSVTQEMLRQAGVDDGEVDGLVQFPRMVRETELAILFREASANETRVSFRSKGTVDVSRLASSLGGGGHKRAAGCTLRLPLEQARSEVLRTARRLMDGGGE